MIQDIIDEIKQQLADAANSHPGLAVIGTVQGGIARIENEIKALLAPSTAEPEPQQSPEKDDKDDKDDEHEDEEPGLNPQVQAPRRPGRI